MKKLFTLVFGVLFAMCANAVTSDIGAPSNNIKDEKANQVFFNPETNVISFYKQWDYRPGWWIGGKDYSEFDEFVLELDNPSKLKIQIVLEYTDTYTKDDKTINYNTTAQGDGDKIVLPLDADHKSSVRQIYLQYTGSDATADAPKTATFKKAYMNADVKGTSTVLFEGEQAFDAWSAQVLIDKDKFVNVKAGDKIIVTGKKGAFKSDQGWQESYGGQIYLKTKRAGWSSLGDNFVMTDVSAQYIFKITDDEITIQEEQVDPNDETKKIKIDVKTTILKELQEYGLAIQGMASVMTKVELVTSGEATNISNSVVAPAAKSAKIYNLAGQQVGASYKGVVIKNGKKYVQK